MSNQALARLLIAKGIFTEAEYTEQVTLCMEEEKAKLERVLSEKLGKTVTLL